MPLQVGETAYEFDGNRRVYVERRLVGALGAVYDDPVEAVAAAFAIRHRGDVEIRGDGFAGQVTMPTRSGDPTVGRRVHGLQRRETR